MFYTYSHAKPDGTIFYIGKGQGNRAWSIKSRNHHWQNITSKYKNYKVQILANWQTEEEAFNHEVLLISCFKDLNFDLANYTNGGEGTSGFKWSSEQLKNRQDKTGNKHPFFGKKRPEVSAKLKRGNCYKAKKIKVFDKIFDCVADYADFYKIKHSTARARANNNPKKWGIEVIK
jgi:hypothetical protein